MHLAEEARQLLLQLAARRLHGLQVFERSAALLRSGAGQHAGQLVLPHALLLKALLDEAQLAAFRAEHVGQLGQRVVLVGAQAIGRSLEDLAQRSGELRRGLLHLVGEAVTGHVGEDFGHGARLCELAFVERFQQVRCTLLRTDQAEQVVEELAHAVEHGRAGRPQREQTFRPELVHVRHALLGALLDLLESLRVLGQQLTQLLLHLRSLGGVEQVLLDRPANTILAQHGEEVMQRLVPRRTHRVAGVHGDLDQALGLVLVHRELARAPDLRELLEDHLDLVATDAADLVEDLLGVDLARAALLRTHGRLLGHDVFEQRGHDVFEQRGHGRVAHGLGLHAVEQHVEQHIPVEGGVPVLLEVVAQLGQQLLLLVGTGVLRDLGELVHLGRVETREVLLHGNVVQRIDRRFADGLGLRFGLGRGLSRTGDSPAPVEYIRATRQGVELLRSPLNTRANPLGHSGDTAHRFETVIQHINALLGFEDVRRIVPLWAVDAGRVIGVGEPLAKLPRFRQREAFVKLLLDILLCNAQL